MTQDIQSINELKSYTEYNVSTPTSVFTIGFQYEYNVDKINVHVDGVEATAAGYTVQHDSQGTVSLTPAVPSGVVRLSRETNIDTSAHTFSAGAKFTAGTMDENFKQLRHSQQESRDIVLRTASEFGTLDANATAALQAANTAVNTANSIDVKATTALSNSSTALSVANGIDAKATTALSNANAAVSTANTADSNAATALSTANSASSVANGIDAKATQAQSDASTALSTASTLSAQKGAANGIATLDANAVVPVAQLPSATTTAQGVVELATQTEVNTGTDSTRAIVPNTLLGGMKTHLSASGAAPIYACRAWVNFNGTGTVAIRASGNVSSITDNGTGSYTVNFTTAMPDTNYSVVGMSRTDGSLSYVTLPSAGVKTTSAVDLRAASPSSGSNGDSSEVNISVFR